MSEAIDRGALTGPRLNRAELEKILNNMAFSASVSLYHELWPPRHYDRELRKYLRGVLDLFGATAMLVRRVGEGLRLYSWEGADPRTADPAYRRSVQNELERLLDDVGAAPPIPPEGDGAPRAGGGHPIRALRALPTLGLEAIIFRFSNAASRGRGFRYPDESDAALVFDVDTAIHACRSDPRGVKANEDDLLLFKDLCLQVIGSMVLPMILDAFRHRALRFASFPAKISQRYWDDALPDRDRPDSGRPHLAPPWNNHSERGADALAPTATLSLDLRKSTFCMDFAASEPEFGRWLDHLVEKMRAVAHIHGGVFDKFTGDGALIHFLQRECELLYDGRSAVDSAIHCAVDLERAVEIHMKSLRRILHHDSQVFGAGIAIDVGHAFWSCDHRDNPIVVGKVVVGACRVGDQAPRQAIRLTNRAYWSMSGDLRGKLKGIAQASLSTKESSSDVPLECWEFSADQELNVGRGLRAIEALCLQIQERFDGGAEIE